MITTRRRRYQNGQLYFDKDRWCARWREDVVQRDGTVKRVRKWDVLVMLKDCPTEAMARRILDEKMRKINAGSRTPAPIMRMLDELGVKPCEPCQKRIVAALQAKGS